MKNLCLDLIIFNFFEEFSKFSNQTLICLKLLFLRSKNLQIPPYFCSKYLLKTLILFLLSLLSLIPSSLLPHISQFIYKTLFFTYSREIPALESNIKSSFMFAKFSGKSKRARGAAAAARAASYSP